MKWTMTREVQNGKLERLTQRYVDSSFRMEDSVSQLEAVIKSDLRERTQERWWSAKGKYTHELGLHVTYAVRCDEGHDPYVYYQCRWMRSLWELVVPMRRPTKNREVHMRAARAFAQRVLKATGYAKRS